jgi:predicted ATPase with chaperone activity
MCSEKFLQAKKQQRKRTQKIHAFIRERFSQLVSLEAANVNLKASDIGRNSRVAKHVIIRHRVMADLIFKENFSPYSIAQALGYHHVTVLGVKWKCQGKPRQHKTRKNSVSENVNP